LKKSTNLVNDTMLPDKVQFQFAVRTDLRNMRFYGILLEVREMDVFDIL
jgi:hypothetical protein